MKAWLCPYLSHQSEILICDFDQVARGAEMVKRRPVVVVTRHDRHRRQLCVVVPLSTTAPSPVEAWHHPLPHLQVTGRTAKTPLWAKFDMLCAVSMVRLNKSPIRRPGRAGTG